MTAQKLLEGKRYVTVSLLVTCMSNLRDGLSHALDYIKLLALEDDLVEIAAKEAAIPFVDPSLKTSTTVGGTVRASPRSGKDEKTIAHYDCPGSPNEVIVRDREPRTRQGLDHRFSTRS